MVTPRLVLVLGDQLTPSLSALAAADKDRDVVVMAEVASETGYVAHHPKKIALVLAAMRKFAAQLRDDGWHVAYTQLDDPDNAGSIPAELLRRASEHKAQRVMATTPGEWRLIHALEDMPLPVEFQSDDRFLIRPRAFADWAKGRRELRMEWFYREMRRKTGLLMEGDAPAGGQWNFDTENRKPLRDRASAPMMPQFDPDPLVEEVLELVEARFGDHFGHLRPFGFATDRAQALEVLDDFIAHRLACFGDYQDAMVTGEPLLWHSLLSPALNLGLLTPLEICQRAEQAYRDGQAPLNAVEGFIRQIIGWREFVRGIYFLQGPEYTRHNALHHDRPLPPLFWGADTGMKCLAEVVSQTEEQAYAHHIQRLMITGNFALLAGLAPAEVHDWYLSVYADAFEWVEAPNTIGMSQFADGGIVASKPYVSSGNYISKMSDYCTGCAYDVKGKSGENACPFNLLYWHFLERHRARFAKNRRMAMIYRGWDKRAPEDRERILQDAEQWLCRLEAGETV